MAATVKLNGDERDLVDAMDNVVDKAKEIDKEYKALAAESRRLERVAKNAFDETRTAAEKYKLRVDDLNKAFKNGERDVETYNRALAQAKQEYEDAENAGRKAFGEDALQMLSSFSSGILSVATGVGIVTSALSSARQEAEALAAIRLESAGSRGELLQGAGTQAEINASLAAVRRLRASGATSSVDQAQQSFAEIQSAGLQQELETFVAIGRSGVSQNIGGLAQAVQSLQGALGKESTGGTESIISKALQGGIVAQAKIDDILRATAGAAAAGKPLGISDEELISAISSLTIPLSGADNAKTALSSFLTQVQKNELGGGNLQDILQRIQSKVEGGQSAIEILGETNAVKGFQFLNDNAEQFRDLLKTIDQANDGRPLRDRVKLAESTPLIAADISRREAEGRNEVQKELIGTQETLINAINKQRDSILAGSNSPIARSGFFRGLMSSAQGVRDYFGFNQVDENSLADLEQSRYFTSRLQPELVSQFDKLINYTKQLLEVQKQLRAGPYRPQIPTPEAAQ